MDLIEKALRRTLYRKSFYEFVKAFWHVADPSKFVDGWLIQYYCEVFQYMCKGWVGYDAPKIVIPEVGSDVNILDVRQNKQNLCLMVPPRHTKSMILPPSSAGSSGMFMPKIPNALQSVDTTLAT